MTTSPRHVIYTRVSKDPDGSSNSPAAQHAECVELARQHGWTDPLHLSDIDTSAWRRDVLRPSWRRVIDGVRDGTIDGLIVHHLDRMLRQVRELEELIDAIESRTRGKFPIYSVHGSLDLSTADGRFQARILTSVAQKESDDKSRRLKLVLGKNARDGKGHGGIAPYGWSADRRTLDPHEAGVVRELVGRVLDGEGLTDLARSLNARGEQTRKGGSWYPTTLKQILTSPRLAGLRTHLGRVVADGDWEPIITVDEHRRLVDLLDRPAHPNHTVRLRYWLTGIVECSACGTKMRSRSHTQGDRYVCRKDHGGCGMGIAAGPLEQLAAGLCVHLLDRWGLQGRVEEDEVVGVQEELDALQLRRDELARDFYAHGALTRSEYEAARSELQREIEQRVAVLAQHRVRSGQQAVTTREEWDQLNASERSLLAAQLLERIVIHPAAPGRRFDPSRIEVWTRAR